MDPFKPYQPKTKVCQTKGLTSEAAETVALMAITFIAADEELLSRFVAASGTDLDDIKRQINQPGFLIGVLDFLLTDESTVVAFAKHGELTPETPMLARLRLAAIE